MVTGTSTSPKRCWLARARTAASSGESASRGSAPFSLRAHRLVGRALGGRALPRARSASLRFRLRGGIGLWQTVLQWFE